MFVGQILSWVWDFPVTSKIIKKLKVILEYANIIK